MTLHQIENDRTDELSTAVTKAMVSVVATMALIVMITVLAFHSGSVVA